MKKTFLVFFLIGLVNISISNKQTAQVSESTLDTSLDNEEPLYQDQLVSDIDLLINTLNQVYAGKFADPTNFKILINDLEQIKKESLGPWALYLKIKKALDKFPDGHLQATPGETNYNINRTIASLPEEKKSGDDVRFKEEKINGNNTLVVSIPTFMIEDPITRQNVIDELSEKNKRADALILDLRGNSGGYREVVLKIGAVLWGENFKEDTIIQYYHMPISMSRTWYNKPIHKLALNLMNAQKLQRESIANMENYLKQEVVIDASSEEHNEYLEDQMQIEKNGFAKPIFILVDNGCASACELMMDVLEMHPYATTIGTQTAGALKYQNPVLLPLPASSVSVLMATSYIEYFDKRNIERVGYKPKVFLLKKEDAFKMATSFIKEFSIGKTTKSKCFKGRSKKNINKCKVIKSIANNYLFSFFRFVPIINWEIQMINKLNTSRSAVFLKSKKPLTKSHIEKIFKDVSQDRVGQCEESFVKRDVTNPVQAKASFLVFKIKDPPSFLKNSDLLEYSYAFLLIIELRNHVVILKKHIHGLDKHLKNYCTKLDYEQIQYLFADQEPSYEKMSMAMMGISKSAILRRTLESTDLKGQVGSQSSRRSIPTNTTVKTKDHRHVLRPNSSSISKSDNKTSFTDLMSWANDICTELLKSNLRSDFLDSFAQPVKLEIVKTKPLKPSALLLNISELVETLTTDAEILFAGKGMDSTRVNSLLNMLSTTFYVKEDNEEFLIYYHNNRGQEKVVGSIKINEQSITIKSEWLSLYTYRRADGYETNLQKYINTHQLFILTFDTPEFIYLERKVFRDKGLSAHCDEIQAILNSHNFSAISSEKGQFNSTSTSFENTSIFGFFEQNLATQSAILVCDDLGDEWADYVEVHNSPPTYKLVHCKHGRTSTSASQLHDVVSQALKNIGRVSVTNAEISNKLSKWTQIYSNTNITRIRSGHSADQVKDMIDSIVTAPIYNKEIILITPFLSKADLTAAFSQLKNNQAVDLHIPQLVWLLSSFVSVCKEIGIKPIIHCSP